MATGMTQKSCAALFPLWSLRKNDISKNKKYKEETQKALKGILNTYMLKKLKAKSILILIKVFSLSITIDTRFSFT